MLGPRRCPGQHCPVAEPLGTPPGSSVLGQRSVRVLVREPGVAEQLTGLHLAVEVTHQTEPVQCLERTGDGFGG